METKPILTGKIGRIGVITLNRPEARNTFTIPFAEQLDEALRTMDEDPEVLVVVINEVLKDPVGQAERIFFISSAEGTFPETLTTPSTASAGVDITPKRHDLRDIGDLLHPVFDAETLRRRLRVLRQLPALGAPGPQDLQRLHCFLPDLLKWRIRGPG